MDIKVDLGRVARDLRLTAESVLETVELLDEGNTVPFITRYRKDRTGGLDEEQIRTIQDRVAILRQLAERKQTVLKSIESQDKLTPELADRVRGARTIKRLEDIYLPFRPKKQTLATAARQRGLEPLADKIQQDDESISDLQTAAAELIDPEKNLQSADDVLQGVGHILAERFSEQVNIRSSLREILRRTGVLSVAKVPSTKIVEPPASPEKPSSKPSDQPAEKSKSDKNPELKEAESEEAGPTATEIAATETTTAEPSSNSESTPASAPSPVEDQTSGEQSESTTPQSESTTPQSESAQGADSTAAAASDEPSAAAAEEPSGAGDSTASTDDAETASSAETVGETATTQPPSTDSTSEATPAADSLTDDSSSSVEAGEKTESADASETQATNPPAADSPSGETPAEAATKKSSAPASPKVAPSAKRNKAVTKRQKKRQQLENAFKDYFDFREPLPKSPPHRVLAINRGERAKVLRVRVDADVDQMVAKAIELAVPAEHRHAEFLNACVRDAVVRLVTPSLTREVRREQTEQAEQHAVQVFVRNLRKLLLQPPVRNRRVLAIDPGFRNGCKIAVLDAFGKVLATTVILIVGKKAQSSKRRLAELVKRHDVALIAIGNGAGCRESEQMVSELMAGELQGRDLAYVVVNEAGASVYSTSPIGREELPKYDAMQRSAISIGRRLLDPLSELVKINPANIGVGMYQHDVKARHLRDSLDAVVESCVNYVGVDVNTASPALLCSVSGLNQLTARRLYEHRLEHGPFKNREEFKNVAGFGDATFVQAAGFLKIVGGDNPLDATWIHPESYDTAVKVLDRLGGSIEELSKTIDQANPASPVDTQVEEKQADGQSGESPATAEASTVESSSIETCAAETSAGETSAAEPIAAAESTSSDKAVPPVTSDPESTASEPAEPSSADGPQESSAAPAATEPAASGSPALDRPAPAENDVAGGAPSETIPIEPASPDAPPVESSSDESSESSPGGATETSAESASQQASLSEDEAENPGAQAAEEPAPEMTSVLMSRLSDVDETGLAAELQIGGLLLKDILTSLARPIRDPREDFPPPMFRRGVMKLEDLEAGIELEAVVLNVVDFGAFVDIGLSDSGLIHISRLADRYVKDPHEIVSVGDRLPVWVVEVDEKRRRVSLTAIRPGSEKPVRARTVAKKKESSSGGPKRSERSQEKGGRAQRKFPKKTVRRDRKPQAPKKSKSITKAMEDGREPMRSFSDLVQFYDKKPDSPDKKK